MELKDLMQELLSAAEMKNKPRALKLDRVFEDSISKNIDNYYDYENLRQSCVLCLTFPGTYDLFIKDAKERFARLYK